MSSKGFTLIELVIVLVIVGFSVSLTAPKFAQLVNKAQFQNDLKRIYSTIRYARSKAVFGGKIQSVMFDAKNGEFWIDGNEKRKLYDGVSFKEIKIAEFKEEEGSEEVKKLDFNQSGCSIGGSITVAMGSNEAVIEVNSFDSRMVIK